MGDIAILVRKRYDIKRLEQYLMSVGIPVFVYKGGGLCELDCIQVIIHFLKGMLRLDDAISWYGIARDILELTDAQLLAISKEKESLGVILRRTLDPALSLVRERCEAWDSALRMGAVVDQLQGLVWSLDLVIQGSDSDKEAVSRFMAHFSDQWQESKGNIHHCLEWLDYCIHHPRAMSLDNQPSGGAVQIMTLHAAKGLEFPKIIVPFIHAAFNFGASDPMIVSRSHGLGVSIKGRSKENKIRSAIFAQEKDRSIREELRLFYVTLTRAKQHILLTGQALSRKNTSRLSMMLPYLDPAVTGQYQFNFDYEKESL